jgi:hypothetical protein
LPPIGLVQEAADALRELEERLVLGRSDVVNRALQVYNAVDQEQADGKQLLLRDRKTGEAYELRFPIDD